MRQELSRMSNKVDKSFFNQSKQKDYQDLPQETARECQSSLNQDKINFYDPSDSQNLSDLDYGHQKDESKEKGTKYHEDYSAFSLPIPNLDEQSLGYLGQNSQNENSFQQSDVEKNSSKTHSTIANFQGGSRDQNKYGQVNITQSQKQQYSQMSSINMNRSHFNGIVDSQEIRESQMNDNLQKNLRAQILIASKNQSIRINSPILSIHHKNFLQNHNTIKVKQDFHEEGQITPRQITFQSKDSEEESPQYQQSMVGTSKDVKTGSFADSNFQKINEKGIYRVQTQAMIPKTELINKLASYQQHLNKIQSSNEFGKDNDLMNNAYESQYEKANRLRENISKHGLKKFSELSEQNQEKKKPKIQTIHRDRKETDSDHKNEIKDKHDQKSQKKKAQKEIKQNESTKNKKLQRISKEQQLNSKENKKDSISISSSQALKKKQEANMGKHQSMQALDAKPNDLARYPNDAKSAADKQSLNIDRMEAQSQAVSGMGNKSQFSENKTQADSDTIISGSDMVSIEQRREYRARIEEMDKERL